MFDEFGRVTEGKDLGQDNPKLFNAAYLLMLKLSGKPANDFSEVIKKDLHITLIWQGLWSRHNEYFRYKNKLLHNPTSHDECNGIVISDMLINVFWPTWSMQMLDYLKDNDNCYADTLPHVRPFTEFRSRPLGYLKDLWAFHRAIKNNPFDEDGQDAKFPMGVVALRYWRRPRDTGFYKLAANQKMNKIEFLDFHLAWIFSLFFSYDHRQQNSGTLMSAYKVITLDLSGRLKWPLKVFNYVMKKRLGDEWFHEMCKDYFKNPIHPEEEHIITSTAKGVKFP